MGNLQDNRWGGRYEQKSDLVEHLCADGEPRRRVGRGVLCALSCLRWDCTAPALPLDLQVEGDQGDERDDHHCGPDGFAGHVHACHTRGGDDRLLCAGCQRSVSGKGGGLMCFYEPLRAVYFGLQQLSRVLLTMRWCSDSMRSTAGAVTDPLHTAIDVKLPAPHDCPRACCEEVKLADEQSVLMYTQSGTVCCGNAVREQITAAVFVAVHRLFKQSAYVQHMYLHAVCAPPPDGTGMRAFHCGRRCQSIDGTRVTLVTVQHVCVTRELCHEPVASGCACAGSPLSCQSVGTISSSRPMARVAEAAEDVAQQAGLRWQTAARWSNDEAPQACRVAEGSAGVLLQRLL